MRYSNPSSLRPEVVWILASVLSALAQFGLVLLVLGRDYGLSIEAAKGIVEGLPHWVIYQSRVLGPYLIEALSRLTGSFTSAHIFYFFSMMSIAGFLLLKFVGSLMGSQKAWAAFLLFHLLFSLLLLISHSYLYAWDHIGIVVFIIFIYFVLSEKDLRWFIALFCIAIFNRESAFFIALWLILSPVLSAAVARRDGKSIAVIDWKKLVCGVTCMIAGFLLVQGLRTALLVKEIGPERFNMPYAAGSNLHVTMDANMTFLGRALALSSYGTDLIVPGFLILVVVVAALLSWSDPRRWLALSISHIALVISLMAFARLSETRVMLELIPFVAVGLASLSRNTKHS